MKQKMSTKIISISNGLNLYKRDIQYIVWKFLEFKQEEVLSGRIIRLGNIVEIVPEPVLHSGVSTLGYVSRELSDKIGYSYVVILEVLTMYIRIQEEQLKFGNSIDFRGIVKIHPVIENKVIRSIHSSVSTALIEKGKISKISGARVHTLKSIKQSLYKKEINTQNNEIEDDLFEEVFK